MARRPALRRPAALVAAVALCIALAGCFDVQSPDLFLLTRTGPGATLTLLVNYGGTISCNHARAKPIPDAMLIGARDLADNLISDASHHLTIPRTSHTVDYFRIEMQQGTISFPDEAASTHPTLAQAELFAVRAAQRICGLPG